jgi:hypothetical protein
MTVFSSVVAFGFGRRSGSPLLPLLLGGVAVHRCDNSFVPCGFSRGGTTLDPE